MALFKILMHVAEHGLSDLPVSWKHEVNKQEGIHEFIKGDLRLFFFEGYDGEIAVCTGGVMKKGQKADKGSVARAVVLKKEYLAAKMAETLELVDD